MNKSKLDPRTSVVGCVPHDPEMVFGIPFTPDPDNVLSTCDWCGREVWIGPRGKRQVASGVPKVCAVCLVISGDLCPENEAVSLEELESS